MKLSPGEGAQILNDCVQDIVNDRGSTIDLNCALTYAERAVVQALLLGQKEAFLNLITLSRWTEHSRKSKHCSRNTVRTFSLTNVLMSLM